MIHVNVHILVLCRKFEPIPIKIRLFGNFKNLAKTMDYSTRHFIKKGKGRILHFF